jgi:hypothetical protein
LARTAQAAAAFDRALHAIEYRILRYRSARGAFGPLVKDLEAALRQVDDSASLKIELRSKWQDLDDISAGLQRDSQMEPAAERRRMAEIVLDEMVDLCRSNREDNAPAAVRRRR